MDGLLLRPPSLFLPPDWARGMLSASFVICRDFVLVAEAYLELANTQEAPLKKGAAANRRGWIMGHKNGHAVPRKKGTAYMRYMYSGHPGWINQIPVA